VIWDHREGRNLRKKERGAVRKPDVNRVKEIKGGGGAIITGGGMERGTQTKGETRLGKGKRSISARTRNGKSGSIHRKLKGS